MQIVIDIPEKTYKHILSMQFYISGLRSGKSLLEEILKAIRTGIPLPKRHGNLIQREEAEAIFRNARMALYKQRQTEQIKDFQTRELMLLNAEQLVHLTKPVIEADTESEE